MHMEIFELQTIELIDNYINDRNAFISVDINECSRSVGQFCSPMTSECVNTPGSFKCQCKEGFESIANGRACQGKILEKIAVKFLRIQYKTYTQIMQYYVGLFKINVF